jgi:hypothetical protein
MALRRNKTGNLIGWVGLVLLLAAWASVWSTPRLSESRWIIRIFAGAAVGALISFFLGIAASRKASKWWYALATAAFVSGLILFADLFAAG